MVTGVVSILSRAYTDHIADVINRDLQSQLAHPTHDVITPGFILITQRHTANAAAVDSADFCQILRYVLAVDRDQYLDEFQAQAISDEFRSYYRADPAEVADDVPA